MADGLTLSLDGGDVVLHLGLRTLSAYLEVPPADVRTLLLTLGCTAALGPQGRATMEKVARVGEGAVEAPEDSASNDAEILAGLKKRGLAKDSKPEEGSDG